MNKRVTAVDWLRIEINKRGPKENNPPEWLQELYTQALAMEKEQIIDSFDEGKSDGYKTAREWDEMIIWLSAEQYYNETYGK